MQINMIWFFFKLRNKHFIELSEAKTGRNIFTDVDVFIFNAKSVNIYFAQL